MKNNLPRLAASAACLLPVALMFPLFSCATVVRAPDERPKIAGDPHGFAGTLTCTGRGCHGAITPNNAPALRQDEFSTWVRHDKHAGAFAVLKGARAKTMATNLAVLNGGQKIEAHEDPRCLACHATPEYAAETSAEGRAAQARGISCETCHGAAQKGGDGWLTAHTTKVWKELDVAGKEKLGMKVLSDPRAEAQVCAGCHVGAPADSKNGLPARDLNHDLMAAGHPRLLFELSAFQANLPAHWRRDKYKADPDHEAKLWAAGRVESARLSLELLKARATEEAGDKKPWPEFAETDCFACHAALREGKTDWRHRPGHRDPKVRAPGSLPFNVWFSSGLPELAKAVGGPDEPLRKEFTQLARLMSKPSPDRQAVVQQADAALQQLAALGGKVNQVKVRALVKEFAATDPKQLAALSWDETTQLVYALAALHEGKEAAPQFTKVYEALAFPQGFESPAEFRRPDTASDADRLTKELSELLKSLAP